MRVRYKIPGTIEYREQEWVLSAAAPSPALDQAGAAMKLAVSAAGFAEWLSSSPYATEITPERLQQLLADVPAQFGTDPRPAKLQSMIRQAASIAGK